MTSSNHQLSTKERRTTSINHPTSMFQRFGVYCNVGDLKREFPKTSEPLHKPYGLNSRALNYYTETHKNGLRIDGDSQKMKSCQGRNLHDRWRVARAAYLAQSHGIPGFQVEVWWPPVWESPEIRGPDVEATKTTTLNLRTPKNAPPISSSMVCVPKVEVPNSESRRRMAA